MSTEACPDSPSAVIAALRAVVPAGIALAGGRIGAATSSPYAEEDATLVRSVDKRRREFVSGRQYARSAMAQLGIPPAAIPILPSRAPQWPAGITGSISHADDACVAVVTARDDFIGVGVDIECASPLSPELYASVCSSSELDASASSAEGIDAAKLLFAVKEAFFKFYHPQTGYFLAFHDVTVRLDNAARRFSLQLREGVPEPAGKRFFDGSCGRAGEFVFAFVALHNARA